MLWATRRRVPASVAAEARLRVPSRRSRLVASNSSAKRRGSIRAGIAVSWWTATSGEAERTAVRTDSASRASASTAVAPIARIASAFRPLRVIATT